MADDAERDRDESGRPRNTRPRDALGRPLPYGSPGVQRIPEDLHLSAEESLRYAQDLLDDGQAFAAHDVLEAAWKDGAAEERPVWQGLAQVAVGITHVQRGNTAGAAALLRRAAGRLGRVGVPAPHRIDIGGLVAYAETLAADLEARRDIVADRLRVQLTAD